MSAVLVPPHEAVRLAEEALSHRAASHQDIGGSTWIRYRDDFHGVDRGTVVSGRGEVVPSYPRIGRIFTLGNGLARHFSGAFYAEEKIDGYNVRLTWVEGEVVPLTRGGFPCPFTADRLRDLVDARPLLRAHPDLVICGEVAGPENPYTPGRPGRGADIAFFAFDLMRRNGGVMGVEERERILGDFPIPRAPLYGPFTLADLSALQRRVLAVDAAGGEGLVFKPVGSGVVVKYVTPHINLADILSDAGFFVQLPGEFFQKRLVRLAIGLWEMDRLDQLDAAGEQLGRALLRGIVDTLEHTKGGEPVQRHYTIRVYDERTIDALFRHMNRVSHEIQVRERGRRREGAHWVVDFVKIYLRATSWLQSIIGGERFID